DDLWGPDARRLREQLQDAADWDDRFSIAEATIRARLEDARRVDRELARRRRVTEPSGGRAVVERVGGIEPPSSAWKAEVLAVELHPRATPWEWSGRGGQI